MYMPLNISRIFETNFNSVSLLEVNNKEKVFYYYIAIQIKKMRLIH